MVDEDESGPHLHVELDPPDDEDVDDTASDIPPCKLPPAWAFGVLYGTYED